MNNNRDNTQTTLRKPRKTSLAIKGKPFIFKVGHSDENPNKQGITFIHSSTILNQPQIESPNKTLQPQIRRIVMK